jgi:protein-S-isoprenylcysteine O-methyltransferase Ste14
MSTPLLIQFLLCPATLIGLLLVSAPYGRHFRPGWGPSLPNRLAWFVMELPALVAILYFLFGTPQAAHPAVWIPLGFWLVHYAYRTLIFPALMRPSDKTFPVVLVAFAIAFNLLNGFNNADALLDKGTTAQAWPDLSFWVGSGVFFAGFVMHVHADTVIRRLRKPGDSSYQIPHGGLFRWISSPHYLGEIIQWIGWAAMTWSLAGLAFALFTICNLAPRAVANQAWYKARFPNYPVQRRILIPGVF